MDENAIVTARISAEPTEQLDRVARDYDRPRSWVIARALERYLEEEIDLLDSLEAAEADIAAGRVYMQERVEEMFGVSRSDRDAA